MDITHGECVCFGTCWELRFVVEQHDCDPTLLQEFRKLAQRLHMPTDESHPIWNTLCAANLNAIQFDKKTVKQISPTTLKASCSNIDIEHDKIEESTSQSISLCCMRKRGDFCIQNIAIHDFILFFQRRMT